MGNLEKLLARKRWIRWVFGGLCWLAIVLFYSTRLSPTGHSVPWITSLIASAGIWSVWAIFLPGIVGCERLLRRYAEPIVPRLLLHAPVSLAITALSVYAYTAVNLFLDGQFGSFSLSFDILRNSWTGLFHTHFLVYWGILGIYIAWDSSSKLRDRQFKAIELERELAEARLGALRTQLCPHFLFNALNAVSAHVEHAPRTARKMLEQLGDLLRLSLSHSEDHEIPLAEEMEFNDKFIYLQQARFGGRLHVKTSISREAVDALVPTFLLEPLVENAIRHGVAPRPEGGHVEIEGHREGKRLRLSVKDDGPGLPHGWDPEQSSGVGIRNTRERLQCLYGDDHTFRISGEPGAGLAVEIEIPYHTRRGGEQGEA